MKSAICIIGLMVSSILDPIPEPRKDPILLSQPGPIQKACKENCPDSFYHILRIVEHQNVKPSTYTVVFFIDNGMIQSKRSGNDWISELLQYKLELAADGQIIEEESHLISAAAVPKAVRVAYQKWNPKGLKGMTVAWGVGQTLNQKREYVVSIVFNQVAASGASFYEDGSLIKEKSDPVPDEHATRLRRK